MIIKTVLGFAAFMLFVWLRLNCVHLGERLHVAYPLAIRQTVTYDARNPDNRCLVLHTSYLTST
jgi:hypothetical protein